MATKSTKETKTTSKTTKEKAPAATKTTAKATTTKAAAKDKAGAESKLLFKATFTDWDAREKGMPFRVIAVASDCTLYKLAEAINKSFNFKLDQPFGFYNNLTKWEKSDVSFEMMDELGDIDDKKLKKTAASSVFTKKGDKMLYFFDYAEEWRFLAEFLGEEKAKAGEKLPFVVEEEGEAPPQYGDNSDLDDDDDDNFEEEDDDDDIFSDAPKSRKKKDADDEFNVDDFDEFAKGGFDDFGGGGFDDFDDKF